jgi:hypothetical protein
MVNLTLAPTRKYFRFGDQDDYVVLDGGRCIGRIFRSPQAPEDHPWFWTLLLSSTRHQFTVGDIQPTANKR